MFGMKCHMQNAVWSINVSRFAVVVGFVRPVKVMAKSSNAILGIRSTDVGNLCVLPYMGYLYFKFTFK